MCGADLSKQGRRPGEHRAGESSIDEVEVGRRGAGRIRVAFEVDDSAAVTGELTGAGATLIAEPTRTPGNSLSSHLEGPVGLRLTLFEELS